MKIFSIMLVIFIVSFPSFASESPVPMKDAMPQAVSDTFHLEDLIQYAKVKNPEIVSAKAEWLAAKKRVWIDTSLPDPMAEFAPGSEEDRYAFSQQVPFPGKLWEKGRMANSEARAAYFRYLAIERDVVNRLTNAYYDLYYTDASIRVIQDVKELLKKFQSVASSRYSNMSGTQRDVAKAQAEVSLSLERLYALEQQRETTVAIINAILNRDPMDSVGKAVLPKKPIVKQSLIELVNLAVKNRQEIKEAEAIAAKSGFAKRLAALAYIPDVAIGFEYNKVKTEDQNDYWMIPIQINIPLWQNRIIPEIQEAKQMENARKAQLIQAKNSTFAEVKDSYYRYQSALKIADLYEAAVIPQAQLALSADQAGYESAKNDFLNLIDSERVYFNAKLSYIQFYTETLKAYADLVRATGLDLDQTLEEREKSEQIKK